MNGNDISVWITELKMWPLIVVLVPNLMFRKYGQAASRKRMASLYQAIAVFLITSTAGFVVARSLTDLYLYGGIAVVAVLLAVFRDRVFPYRLVCGECSARLDFKTIYFMDDNLCPACHGASLAEETQEQDELDEEPDEELDEEQKDE